MNAANAIVAKAVLLGGYQWHLPPDLAYGPAGSVADPDASRLRLFEDGMDLGPANCSHGDIEKLGGGRFSHWADGLRFSTSDGSDPNENGRRYSFALARPKLKVAGFGGCHTHAALQSLAARGFVKIIAIADRPVHSIEEVGAVVDFSGPAPQVDVLVIEPSSPINFLLGERCIPRSDLSGKVFDPIIQLGPEEAKHCKRWVNQGLIRANEAARLASAEALKPLYRLPRFSDVPLLDILDNLRARPTTAQIQLEGVKALGAHYNASSVLVITSPNAYLPDGRPLTWPGNFPREIGLVCEEEAVPVLHSSSLVKRYGVAVALEDDHVHFKDDFGARYGDAILERLLRD